MRNVIDPEKIDSPLRLSTTYTGKKLNEASAYVLVAKVLDLKSNTNDTVLLLSKAFDLNSMAMRVDFPLGNSVFKQSKVEIENKVLGDVRQVLEAPEAEAYSQTAAALEAATILNSFNFQDILVHYTRDDSVMFEFIQAGMYVLLEVFDDGDIAYLTRKGKEKPKAYDITRSDLYAAIESIYDRISRL